MEKGRPPGPWHEAYEPIEDADTEAFVFQSLEKAKQQFGEPVIPVNEIIFRRSRKTEAARRYRIGEDFSLTQCIDPTNGVFVIYIGVDPDHENYYPLLGHECAHLINAHITDWYMEGIATVFSEEVCADAGKGWGSWDRHFSRSRKDPYALSYRMMKGLKETFPEQYPALLAFATQNGKRPPWLQINMDDWLETLPDGRENEALDIIEPNVKVLRRQVNDQYGFVVPAALD
ncbi:hypothetical protein P4E94_08995 [Pontiellaceae bacterium B12219]|nr:hypothetical protein [Pontiellaceae bacterium B12219]